jgi:hypothetical protein
MMLIPQTRTIVMGSWVKLNLADSATDWKIDALSLLINLCKHCWIVQLDRHCWMSKVMC